MSSYDSMKTKLEPVGLYSISEGSNISNELKAYAEGIDPLFEDLDVMTRECFIDTAETYGITQRENFTGKERSDYTLEQRREMLRLQEQNMGSKCNKAAFEDKMRSFGVYDFYFYEYFSKDVLAIPCGWGWRAAAAYQPAEGSFRADRPRLRRYGQKRARRWCRRPIPRAPGCERSDPASRGRD